MTENSLGRALAALAAGTTIVTANNRAAGWLRERHDRGQAAAGRAVWPTPQVMPWNAWLRTLWRRLRDGAAEQLQLLTPWQEKRLWHRIIASNGDYAGLHAANAAALAASAWEIAQAWDGPWRQWGGSAARDEHRAFVAWAAQFAHECAANHWIDAARLPQLLIEAIRAGSLVPGAPVGLFGFAETTPQQQALIDAMIGAGTSVTRFEAATGRSEEDLDRAVRVGCDDPAHEWRLCAEWCREQLAENPHAALGVVIPDLAAQRPQVERVFADVLAPSSLLNPHASEVPINISQSDPIAGQPLVDIALTLLGWQEAPLGPAAVRTVVRSPYLGGAENEWPQRAQLVLALAQEPREKWRAGELARFANARCPALCAQLRAFEAATADFRKRRDARAWRQAWDNALQAAGWLGDGRLDSAEYQARTAWNGLLDDWMRAESISGALRHGDALSSLQRLAMETAFQPEHGAAPIQILGTLEAAGLAFDGLWVCGLTAERWPAAPQPSPLLPLAWQRLVAAPHASAERELRYHRALTAQFAAAATQVVFSWPKAVEGIPATVSPLLGECAEIDPADLVGHRSLPLAMQMMNPAGLPGWEDAQGVPVPQPGARGRVSVLEAQAACPFQAYAGFRLAAAPWPRRSIGLTAAERGTLLHAVLAAFWKALPGQAALLGLDSKAWRAHCEEAVDAALAGLPAERWHLLGEAFRRLECERLLELLRQWLDLEAQRPPFEVVACESQRALTVDGLELRLKIDRIDRIGGDQLVVIDYKTGKSGINDLDRDDRLLTPQLPLYAEALAPEPVGAVAYATVRCGESRVTGIAMAQGEWTALRPATPDWPAARDRWRRQIAILANEYCAGSAAADPWRYPNTCTQCGRHALCRINEHIAMIAQEDDLLAGDRMSGDDDSR